MADDTVKQGSGEVKVDLEKYTELVLKVDEAQDKIKEMEKMSKELKIATAAQNQSRDFHSVHYSVMRMTSTKNQLSDSYHLQLW